MLHEGFTTAGGHVTYVLHSEGYQWHRFAAPSRSKSPLPTELMVQNLYHLIRVKGDIITVRCQYSILQLVEGVHQRRKYDSDRPGLESGDSELHHIFGESAAKRRRQNYTPTSEENEIEVNGEVSFTDGYRPQM